MKTKQTGGKLIRHVDFHVTENGTFERKSNYGLRTLFSCDVSLSRSCFDTRQNLETCFDGMWLFFAIRSPKVKPELVYTNAGGPKIDHPRQQQAWQKFNFKSINITLSGCIKWPFVHLFLLTHREVQFNCEFSLQRCSVKRFLITRKDIEKKEFK